MGVRGADGCGSGRIASDGRVRAGAYVLHVAEAMQIRGKCGGGTSTVVNVSGVVFSEIDDAYFAKEKKPKEAVAMEFDATPELFTLKFVLRLIS